MPIKMRSFFERQNLWRAVWVCGVLLSGVNSAVYLAKAAIQSRTKSAEQIVASKCMSLSSQIPKGARILAVLGDPQLNVTGRTIIYTLYGHCRVDAAYEPVTLETAKRYAGVIYCDKQLNVSYYDHQEILAPGRNVPFITKETEPR